MRPATTRSENVSERARRDLSPNPTQNSKTNKNEDSELARGDLLSDLPEWLQEFRENLVEERVPEHRAPALVVSHLKNQ